MGKCSQDVGGKSQESRNNSSFADCFVASQQAQALRISRTGQECAAKEVEMKIKPVAGALIGLTAAGAAYILVQKRKEAASKKRGCVD
jgi:hypothetical protein